MRTKKTCGTCKWWWDDPDRYGMHHDWQVHLGHCLLANRDDAPLRVWKESKGCEWSGAGLETYSDFSCKAWRGKS